MLGCSKLSKDVVLVDIVDTDQALDLSPDAEIRRTEDEGPICDILQKYKHMASMKLRHSDTRKWLSPNSDHLIREGEDVSPVW